MTKSQMTQTAFNAYAMQDPTCLKCWETDDKLYWYGSNREIFGIQGFPPVACPRCHEILVNINREQFDKLQAWEKEREMDRNEQADA